MPEDRSPCRDFERGVCSRGDSCKYYHPEGAAPAEGAKLPICKDYQNKNCGRFKCKFLHITVEEEAEYNSTGKLPEHGGDPEKTAKPGSKNICRDFLNGKCDRGTRCKFSHTPERGPHGNSSGMYGKRPRADDFYGGPPHHNDPVLFEENEFLRRKVADLQKEAGELRQMNDTLYEQNSRYRLQLEKSSTSATSHISAYSQVVYPQYSQAAYPPKSAAVPMASAAAAAGVSAYNYQHY